MLWAALLVPLALTGCAGERVGLSGWQAPSGAVEVGPASPGNGAHATVTFDDAYNATGWATLWVSTAASFDVEASLRNVYVAGFLEGAVTHHLIWAHYLNMLAENFPPEAPLPAAMARFAEDSYRWTADQARAHLAPGSSADADERAYWGNVLAVVRQFEGLVAGYNSAAPAGRALRLLDLLILNMDGDIETLLAKFEAGVEERRWRRRPQGFRCSALVKLLPDGSDLLFSHATWDDYAAMVRIYKHYSLHLPAADPRAPVRRRRVSFSASPAFLSSIDDWFITDSGLVVMETTNGVYTAALLDLVQPKAVMSWIRSIVANALARDGRAWCELFARHNSGTYNNQWMVLDLSRFEPSSAAVGPAAAGPAAARARNASSPAPGVRRGLLHVLEQIPGRVRFEDETAHLARAGYWASYNVPAFRDIFVESGFEAQRRKYGDEWSHERCPRANIFRARQAAVTDLPSMQRLMRYNDWQRDPLSLGDPINSISGRGDLRADPAERTYGGGIDAKVSTPALARRLAAWAQNGPTHDQQPPFDWRQVPGAGGAARVGQPDRFDFGFVLQEPGW